MSMNVIKIKTNKIDSIFHASWHGFPIPGTILTIITEQDTKIQLDKRILQVALCLANCSGSQANYTYFEALNVKAAEWVEG